MSAAPGSEVAVTDLITSAPATTAGPKARTVGMADDVPPGEGRTFVVCGTQVAVFRLRDGSLHATQAACPHAGGPLADGQTDLDVLICPLHQYAYRWADGASTSGAAPITTYPVRERDGYLVVEV